MIDDDVMNASCVLPSFVVPCMTEYLKVARPAFSKSFDTPKYHALSYAVLSNSASVLCVLKIDVVVPVAVSVSTLVSLLPPNVTPACVPIFPVVPVDVFGPRPIA